MPTALVIESPSLPAITRPATIPVTTATAADNRAAVAASAAACVRV
jgi:hypothetical protein